MNKNLNVMFGLALASIFISCKKESIDESPKGSLTEVEETKSIEKTGPVISGVYNFGTQATIGLADAQGYHHSAWGGGIYFTALPTSTSFVEGSLYDGPVNPLIWPGGGIVGDITAIGPYIILKQEVIASIPSYSDDLSNFSNAYYNYINQTPEYPGGPLKQSNAPRITEYMKSSYTYGSWRTEVFTGVIVRSAITPSTLVIMPGTYVPTTFIE
mgnify:CR=1 FL=1